MSAPPLRYGAHSGLQPMDSKELDGQIANLGDQLNTYQQQPNADPALGASIQGDINHLTNIRKGVAEGEAADAKAKAQASKQGDDAAEVMDAPALTQVAATKAGAVKTAETNAEAATPTGKLDRLAKVTTIQKNQAYLKEHQEQDVVAFDPNFKNPDGSMGGNVVMQRAQAQQAKLPHYKADPATINSTIGGFKRCAE